MNLEQLKEYCEEKGLSKDTRSILKSFINCESVNEDGVDAVFYENLNNEKERFSKEFIHFKDIHTVVSFLSMSEQKFEAFEKTVHIFNEKIKNIILFYTEQSKEKVTKIITKHPNIKILSVDITNYIDDYNELRIRILDNILEVSRENNTVLIDNTMGFKMVSFAMYQISVEQNIKTINWSQIHIKNKDNRSVILPGSDTYNIVKTPRMENYSLYKNINKAVRHGNFETLYMIYNQINNYNKSKIYNFLNTVFSGSSIYDYNIFKKNVGDFISEICKLPLSKDEKKIFNKIIIILNNISNDNIKITDNDNTKNIELLNSDENWNRQNLNIILDTNNTAKYYIWRYISLILLEIRENDTTLLGKKVRILLEYDSNYIEEFESFEPFFNKLENSEKWWLYYKKLIFNCMNVSLIGENYFESKIDKETIQDKKVSQYKEVLEHIDSYYISQDKYYDEILKDVFDLSEKLDRKLIVQNDKIYIEKLDITMKLTDVLKSTTSIPSRYVISSIERDEFLEYQSKEFIRKEIFESEKKDDFINEVKITDNSISKALQRIWKTYKEFNKKAYEIYEIKDFFQILDDKLIKINDDLL